MCCEYVADDYFCNTNTSREGLCWFHLKKHEFDYKCMILFPHQNRLARCQFLICTILLQCMFITFYAFIVFCIIDVEIDIIIILYNIIYIRVNNYS